MAKRFTLSEAQRLVPQVDRLLRAAVESKTAYEAAEREIQEFQQRVMLLGGIEVDRERVLDSRNRRDAAASELRSAIQEIQETGCLVKDLDIGLVDFPTSYRGEEVYLCWKLGESSIEYWHGVDEGFRGRKPIDDEFRAGHEDERAH